MTKEEIFKLAERAGFYLSALDPECGRIWWSDECPLDDELLRFADLVLKAERQACAELVQVHMTAASIDLGVAICVRGRK